MGDGYLALYFAGVLLASGGQVLLKLSAGRPHRSLAAQYLNGLVAGGYALLGLSSLATVLAYRGVPLSAAPLLSAAGYLVVGLAGVVLFRERPTRKRVCGWALILAGVCLAGSLV